MAGCSSPAALLSRSPCARQVSRRFPTGCFFMNLESGAALASADDRRFMLYIAVVSTIAIAFLAWLLLFRRTALGSYDLSFIPAVNASLNGLAACFLLS